MANRTTVKNNIVAQNVPTVSNADLTAMLNTELADNLVFREDVVVAQSSSVSSITVDFTGKDRVELTRTGGSLAITLSGLGDGDVKWLLVNKTSGQTISFSLAGDVTPLPANLTAAIQILYMVVKKVGAYPLVRAMYNTVLVASNAEMLAGTEQSKVVTPYRLNEIKATLADMTTTASPPATKIVTPENIQQRDGGLITKILPFTGWNMDTTTNKTVAHGLGVLWDNVCEISAIVYSNVNPVAYVLGGAGIGGELRGSIHIDGTNVTLLRTTGGVFDSVNFNSASGFVVVRYALS